MRSSKSRSRSKSSRNRSNPGNVVNRVFDSSGPEGKVRGTPQQIIDKYQTLARDAQLSGDRVNAENFLQHAEHYVRLLSEAQKEIDARREQQEQQQQRAQQNQQRNDNNNNNNNNNQQQQPSRRRSDDRDDSGAGEQPNLPEGADLFPADDDMGSNLVDTPESGDTAAKPKAKPRTPRKRAEKPKVEEEAKAAE